ncbi:MAG TPA: hypothetical protein VND22_06240 [Actinomycetota bacterium]|nr:hypothetical protein [Actinomycetota bacterium]
MLGLDGAWLAELKSTSRDPDKAAAIVAKALEAYVAGDHSRATTLSEEAKAAASRSPRVRELLGLSYYHTGQWQEATRELLTFRRMTASPSQNHVIADCYRALGRADRAIEICSEVQPPDVTPEVWTEVVIVAASAIADKGDLRRAIGHLAKGELEPKSVEPHHLRLWYVRSDLLEKSGRREEAVAGWERIAAEDPEFFDIDERISDASGGISAD